MINHVRTLLLNESGPRQPDLTIPGDVYIPEFTAQVLPGALESLYTVLFGVDADYRGKLYRAAQYMAVLHSTEYERHVLSADPRVTYRPRDSGVSRWSFGPSVTSSQGAPTAEVLPPHSKASEFSGRALLEWTVTAVTGLQVLVRDTRTGNESYTDLSLVDGSLSDIPLHGSSSVLRVLSGGAELTPGDLWQVRQLRRLEPDVSGVLAMIPAAAVQDVFVGRDTEPVKTFWNLLTTSDARHMQLTGLLLAFARRLDGLRGQR